MNQAFAEFLEIPIRCNRCGTDIPKNLIACPHCVAVAVAGPKPRVLPETIKPDVDGLFDASTPPIRIGVVTHTDSASGSREKGGDQ